MPEVDPGRAERSRRARGSTAESTARPEGVSAFCRQPESEAGAHRQPERAEPRTQPPSVRLSPREAGHGAGGLRGTGPHGTGRRCGAAPSAPGPADSE